MKHETIWKAVDNLAKSLEISPAALARNAGLDSTTFNKSKRIRPDGKLRFPSMESINKVLEYCNLNFGDFYKYGYKGTKYREEQKLPFMRISNKFDFDSFAEAPLLNTSLWEKIAFPLGICNTYALEIDSDHYKPLYPQGSILLLTKNTDINSGDRVAIFTKNGDIILAEFERYTSKSVELVSLRTNRTAISLKIDEVAYINRILWASQ